MGNAFDDLSTALTEVNAVFFRLRTAMADLPGGSVLQDHLARSVFKALEVEVGRYVSGQDFGAVLAGLSGSTVEQVKAHTPQGIGNRSYWIPGS